MKRRITFESIVGPLKRFGRRIAKAPTPKPAPPKQPDAALDTPALAEWATAMSPVARGRSTLANLLHDCCAGRLSEPSAIARLFNNLGHAWQTAERHALPDTIYGAEARKMIAAEGCQGVTVKGQWRCSRLLSITDLRDYNLDDDAHLPIRGYVDPRTVDFLVKGGLAQHATGAMSGPRGFAWVTRTDAIESLRDLPDPADAARDQLGLSHITEDQHLVEIEYPDDADVDLHVPTAVEGCPSLIYRSKTAEDGWGRAVRLDDLEDGLPEAVHQPIPFGPGFRLHDFGRLKTPARPVDWDAFEAKLPERWDDRAVERLHRSVRGKP